jgi:imidazolonepropionase-like amidohydrolase
VTMKKVLLSCIFGALLITAKGQQTFPVNGPTDPRHITYAFTHATLYTDYQTVLNDASLLVRDGLIIEAGASVTIPADAVVYNLKGKYIYPSFIDIFSDYGLPEVKKPTPNDAPQMNSNQKGAYNWNQAIHSDYDAYRNFTVDAKRAEELRKLGFGSVMSVYRDGIVRGTSVLALTGNGKENDLIVKDKVASNLSFDKGSSTQDYPSSLMGSIALLRQTYYDADWYKDGGYAKEYNITLDAFNKTRTLPQIFEAGDKQNQLRAARIAREFNTEYIIKGDGSEYERLEDIVGMNSAVIVPVNFPDAFDISDPYEAINISLAQMKKWELAPLNPKMLDSVGVEFALTASGLKNKSDFIKNIRKAIDYGLNPVVALKALTFIPAKMMNSGDQLGVLKKGAIANFLITSKMIFDKDNAILENWVKGIPYRNVDPQSTDIRGNYSLKVGTQNALRLKIGGELLAPEAIIYEDTLSGKIAMSRQGSMITLQYELKKKEPKGVYRLSGIYNDSLHRMDGSVMLPSGEWAKWSATLDSAFIVAPGKTDSIKKLVIGNVTYPDMAYGWKKLPVAHAFVIKNATVWTNESDGILKNTDVYVVDGKINKVGKGISVPDGTESIDGTNMHLTSGIIDEHSHIAISGDVNEATQSSSAEVRIGDVVDAEDIQVYRQLAGGVTTAHLLHGSANPIGGQTALIKLRWGQSPEKMKFEKAPGFIKFALGENVKQAHWGDKQVVRFPQTRMGVEQVYVDYFTRAKEYSDQQKAFATGNTDGSKKIPVRRQLELDALSEIMQGKRFITCHSYVQSEINMLMHVADSFGFKVNTFTHILEGYKVADKMKAHGVSGVSTFSDWWAYKFEVYEAIPYNGALMHNMGLNVSYNSDDPEMARRLNQEAAKAVKYGGVSEVEAWKFVTLNPAKMLHIDDRVGSIRAGKDADLVLWNDNPLSIYAHPLQTYVDGIKYWDIQSDSIMQKDMITEKARLMQKMSEAKAKGESTRKAGVQAQHINHCDGGEDIYFK